MCSLASFNMSSAWLRRRKGSEQQQLLFIYSYEKFPAEQCVKLLEHICQRETSAVYDAGGLQCMLSLVTQYGQSVHKVVLLLAWFLLIDVLSCLLRCELIRCFL